MIKTLGCEGHLQLRNKLKGVALEKLVCNVLKFNRNDLSIKSILGLMNEKSKDYFIVKQAFKLSRINKELTFQEYDLLNINDLKMNVYDLSIYEGEEKTKWSQCNNCGQMYPTDKLKTKKCRKCKIGWFRGKVRELNYLKRDSKINIINYLLEESIIKKPKFSSRLDGFSFSNGILTIFECKNKEVSGLMYSDVIITMIYPDILLRCGYTIDSVRIIYNGAGLLFPLDRLRSKLRFNIELVKAVDYLTKYGDGYKNVVIDRVDGVYRYEIVDSDDESFNVIIKVNGPLIKRDNKLKNMR